VPYAYDIGKYEVTNEEYCDFLNAVAKKDRYGLYDPRMDGGPEDWGGISRSGGYGKYTYTVRDGMGKKPVGYVTMESCARYANWLTNGQKDGDTEKGSYAINGGTVTTPDHAALAKEKGDHWVVSSENEWYKAAYFDPKKSGGAGYWRFPAKNDFAASANLNTNAPSEAGSYQNAASAYGTFDHGGNVWEYSDSQSGGKFGLRGGSFYINDNDAYLQSSTRYDVLSAKWPNYGFRVVRLGSGK
jgi:formylglycine-generating enzyme required for sulfatase activity